MRTQFHERLERIEHDLLALGELSATAVQRAVRALVTRDDALANEVIAGDDAIDERYLEIDQGTLSMVALQAPVAADLRLVSAILHSCLHLERMGDQAVNIAKIQLTTTSLPASPGMLAQIDEMGELVVQMIRIALEAFAQRDVARAEQLQKLDDPVDRLNRATHIEALKLAEDPPALDWGLHANLAARALERVGDQAVDIGEQVAYLVTGEFREFTDASHKVEPHKTER
ncbi:MAG: phosphate signaling complex protein PhoU [Actinomycetota bacterium]|nr:phosphate signaling complex protein PhoU [Actinomycetota bacterium]